MSTPGGLLLPSVLDGPFPSSTQPPLVVISDSVLQPGLIVLRHLIASALSRNENVVLVALEQTPSRLLPAHYDESKVAVLPSRPGLPFATSSTSTDSALTEVRRALHTTKRGTPVVVVLDSVDELASEHGVAASYAFLRATLKALHGRSGSRLLTIHHSHYPCHPSSSLSPSLLATLLSPSLSPSTLHLTLYPSPLLETFSYAYGLVLPSSSSLSQVPDLRLHAFLASFAARSYGDPLVRPSSSSEEDERIPLDGLGSRAQETGVCVVDWSARGVSVPGEGLKRGEGKKVLVRGTEGLRSTERGIVEGVRLGQVLRGDKMGTRMMAETTTTVQKKKEEEPALPFNLSLTDAQKAARETVVLPYLPREGGAEIEYVPDEADDLDDDDPDEDLEI